MTNEKNNQGAVDLREHTFDGIQEEQNPMPSWWLYKFYFTIVFAALYLVIYHVLDGPSLETEYQRDKLAYENTYLKGPNKSKFPEEQRLLAVLASAPDREAGKGIFTVRCSSCHGNQGEGGIGPNLADNFWINGDGKPASFGKVIYEGVAAKGMPPWGGILSEDEMYKVTSFVASLKGTNPPNPKAPQGNEQK